MAKPKRWWNGRGFSQNWPQHFQVLGIIVKHHENSGVFEILPKKLFGIQRSPNNSWKGSLRFPKGELYFPSETTRAKVCRLRWGIAWVSTFPVWALGSICDVLSLRVFIDIYIYLLTYLHIHMHIIFIVMCGIALCFIALYYLLYMFCISTRAPNIWQTRWSGVFPVKLGGHRTLCWCPGEVCLEGAPIWDGWIQCWNERCFILLDKIDIYGNYYHHYIV